MLSCGMILGRRWFIMRKQWGLYIGLTFDASFFLSAFLFGPLQLTDLHLASWERPTVCDQPHTHPGHFSLATSNLGPTSSCWAWGYGFSHLWCFSLQVFCLVKDLVGSGSTTHTLGWVWTWLLPFSCWVTQLLCDNCSVTQFSCLSVGIVKACASKGCSEDWVK